MAENINQVVRCNTAAGTAQRVYFAPPTSTRKWRVKSITEMPNATSATNGTNYCTRTPKVGSTTIATAIDTSATSITQASAVNWTLTGVGSQLEVTQAAPLSMQITHSGTGVAYDCDIVVEFEEVRV